METLLGKSGYKDNRCIRQILELLTDILFPFFHGVVVFLKSIPLIDHDDHPFTCFVGKTCDTLVVLTDAFFGIEDHQDHVRTVNGTHGTHNRIFLRIFIDFTRLTHTSCINHGKLLSISICKMGINGIASRSSYWTSNHAVFSQNGVDQT